MRRLQERIAAYRLVQFILVGYVFALITLEWRPSSNITQDEATNGGSDSNVNGADDTANQPSTSSINCPDPDKIVPSKHNSMALGSAAAPAPFDSEEVASKVRAITKRLKSSLMEMPQNTSSLRKRLDKPCKY